MGFPGEGTDLAERRLKKLGQKRKYALFISIAASKPSFENGTAIADYIAAAKQLLPYGDMHEINVSSPNTPGVKGLQEPEVFEELVSQLQEVYQDRGFFVKFSPDLPPNKLFEDAEIAMKYGAKGISLTNTTTDPEIRNGLRPDQFANEIGGISGAPLRQKALEVSHAIYSEFGDRLPIKFAGGIQTAEHAWNALTYGGARSVGAYTAFVRRPSSTPNFAHYLLSNLAKGMRLMGMHSMADFEKLRGKNIPFLL